MNADLVSLDSIEMLDRLFVRSRNEPVVLFKHSDSCSISSNVFSDLQASDLEINVVVVQSARHISDLIAKRTGIRHQSPQAIVLSGETAVYHASHYDIDADKIRAHVASHPAPETTI